MQTPVTFVTPGSVQNVLLMLVSPLIFRLAGTAAQFKEIIVRSGGCMTDNYAESLGKRIAED